MTTDSNLQLSSGHRLSQGGVKNYQFVCHVNSPIFLTAIYQLQTTKKPVAVAYGLLELMQSSASRSARWTTALVLVKFDA
jgi:hypothetical protein